MEAKLMIGFLVAGKMATALAIVGVQRNEEAQISKAFRLARSQIASLLAETASK